jgi:multidrug efflux system membrane fusion protein
MSIPYTLDANGQVTPMQTATVAPQVDGIIKRVAFREGEDVTRGQVLFQIDPIPYRAAYQQALAALARDQATAQNAQAEVVRYDQLMKQDYVTKEQADQERATAASAVATVQADEANVASAKFNLDNTVIRAPISGRTGSLLVREGNLVHGAAGTALVVINQIKPILVRFTVPGTGLPLIQKYGAHGGLQVTAVPGAAQTPNDSSVATTALTPASNAPERQQVPVGPGGATREHGTLYFIDNAVDTTTGTVTLKATFPNTNETLWTGQFVEVSLQLLVEQNVLVVPTQSVTTGQQGTYVYVIDSAGKATQRTVTVERTAGKWTVIASGVQEGERVVTEGQSRLTPGAKASVRPDSTSAAAPAAGQRHGHGKRPQQ